MPVKDGRICVSVRCSCGSETDVVSGTYGAYCRTCGKSIFTSDHREELNEEIKTLIHTEKLKIRKEKKGVKISTDFSIGSSFMLSECFLCGAALPADNVFIVDGEIVCKHCYETAIPKCKGCGDRHFKKNLNKKGICQGCEEAFTTCPSCGATIDRRKTRTFTIEGVERCDNCVSQYLKAKGVIFDGYSTKPRPIFFGDKEDIVFFGVELEMDNSNRRNEFMARSHTDEIYYKSDGSLSCGVELVTHPATLAYHMETMPWANILSSAKSCGYKSHMGSSSDGSHPTCGLHVHVNREAFGKGNEQDSREAKLLVIFDKFWPQLVIFSRRDKSSLERWARRYATFDVKSEELDAIIKKAKGENSGNRRYAVNFTGNGGKTVEFRLFRGTLQYSTIIATIQLLSMIVEATKLSTSEVQDLTWEDFCAEGERKYSEFAEYISRLRASKKKI
jgi:hypothetical protein